jgi:antitoxin (DNA-binding transcriptional repressor) of toxin-antitoxin stability system
MYILPTRTVVREATFTELRNNAKAHFDAVENGETIRVYRNGKPIAEIVPIHRGNESWKRTTNVLTVKGLALGAEILKDRDAAA